MNMLLRFGIKFEKKTMNYYQNLFLKCDVLLFGDVFENFVNNSLKNYYVQKLFERSSFKLGYNT